MLTDNLPRALKFSFLHGVVHGLRWRNRQHFRPQIFTRASC